MSKEELIESMEAELRRAREKGIPGGVFTESIPAEEKSTSMYEVPVNCLGEMVARRSPKQGDVAPKTFEYTGSIGGKDVTILATPEAYIGIPEKSPVKILRVELQRSACAAQISTLLFTRGIIVDKEGITNEIERRVKKGRPLVEKHQVKPTLLVRSDKGAERELRALGLILGDNLLRSGVHNK